MLKLNHDVLLKLSESDFIESDIKIVSNDSLTHFMTIKVVDDFLSEIDYSQVSNAIIIFAKQDGNVVQGNLTKTQNGYTYTMGTNEIVVPGIVIACVQLLGSSGERLTTSRFKFNVIGDLINDSAVESSTEFAILQRLKQELESIDVVELTNTVNNHLSDIAAHGTMARQAIINGNFDVWQRGTSFTNPANNSYTADRWINAMNTVGTFPTVTHSRQPLTTGALSESFYYYNINVNGAGSGYGANDYYVTAQKIENGTRFLCGANKKITLAFWAKSDIYGKKIGVYGYQNYGTGGSPSTTDILVGTTFTLSSSWAKYTVTFDTHTLAGKTFGTNNDDHLDIDFAYLWGDSFASTRINTSASENFIAAGDISIAQVQLCAGNTALPFTPKSYAEELILCQRYYEVINALNCYLYCDGTPRSLNFSFKTTKRVAPTCKVYDGTGNENKVIFVTSGYVSEQNKPLYGDVPVSSLSTVTISFVPPAGYINVGFNKLIADAEL